MTPALIGPTIPESHHSYYQGDQIKYLAPYVRKLLEERYPIWMVDIERRNFKNAVGMDNNYGLGFLSAWNLVRAYHGFPTLTVEELIEREKEES